MPTLGGTPGLHKNRPKKNARVVKKLLDAGAIVFAKAKLHELAYGVTTNNASYGAARNPVVTRSANGCFRRHIIRPSMMEAPEFAPVVRSDRARD
jgi:Asp-tRNA(Asn)/Glu-tRNA(Gln) amidotransferase A subunit family amidase